MEGRDGARIYPDERIQGNCLCTDTGEGRKGQKGLLWAAGSWAGKVFNIVEIGGMGLQGRSMGVPGSMGGERGQGLLPVPFPLE